MTVTQSPQPTLLDRALTWAAAEFAVIPVFADGSKAPGVALAKATRRELSSS